MILLFFPRNMILTNPPGDRIHVYILYPNHPSSYRCVLLFAFTVFAHRLPAKYIDYGTPRLWLVTLSQGSPKKPLLLGFGWGSYALKDSLCKDTTTSLRISSKTRLMYNSAQWEHCSSQIEQQEKKKKLSARLSIVP